METKETGRTMLEMIAVIVLIILLSIGSLMGYKQVVARHQATVLHQDIMVEASSRRGDNAQKKSTYDSRLGNKTRQGLTMETERSSDTFTIIVNEVSAALCSSLKKKDWKDALRIKINKAVYLPNDPDQIQCPSGDDNFKLSLIFPYKVSAIEAYQDFCHNDDDCMRCQTCHAATGTCQNDCETGEICADNRCVHQCSQGQKLVGGRCESCETGYDNKCPTCDIITPYWTEDKKCVCHKDSCGTNFYCDANGECQKCEDPSESCILSEDKVDETTQCLITKKISCADPNPDCNITTGECMHCDAPTQRCDKEEKDPTTGCTTIEKISCDENTPACLSNGNCGPCPNNATCNKGTITCNDGYYRKDDECQKCNDPKTSCKITKDTTDENGCITEKKTTCSRETPACYDDGVCRKCPNNSGLTEEGPEISGSPCKCKSGYAYDETEEKCVKDACGGNACCLEMLSLGFEIDPDCTEDTCKPRIVGQKTPQKSETFFMDSNPSSITPYPYYLGNMTLKYQFEKCSELYVEGNLDVWTDLNLDYLGVIEGTLTIQPNKNVTLGHGNFGSTIIESGSVLELTSAAGSACMGKYDPNQFINKGTFNSSSTVIFPKTFENYGTMTISGDILQDDEGSGSGVSFLNNGMIQAENLGDATFAANTSVINNGTLTLSGALGVSPCSSSNSECGNGLTNSGTITASTLEGRFLSNTGGTITISGDVLLGHTNTSKRADTAIDISGGSVNIGGEFSLYALNTGIKLSGSGQLTLTGKKRTVELSTDATGSILDVSDEAQLIYDGSKVLNLSSMRTGPAIKVSGNGKIKSKKTISTSTSAYSIQQTGGQILACDFIQMHSQTTAANITGGVLASTSYISADFLENGSWGTDPVVDTSFVKPYANIPWCRSSGTCDEGEYESDGLCVACEATFERISRCCPDRSKPYWNGTACVCPDHATCADENIICDNGYGKNGYQCVLCDDSYWPELTSGCSTYKDCASGEYCKITGSYTAPDTGTCTKIRVKEITYNDETYLWGPAMTFWSARDYCKAQGKRLISLSDFGITRGTESGGCVADTCTGEGEIDWDGLTEAFGVYSYWTNDVSRFCETRYNLRFENKQVTMLHVGYASNAQPLCK